MTSFAIYLGIVEHVYPQSSIRDTQFILGSEGPQPLGRHLHCYATAGQTSTTTRSDWSETSVPCPTKALRK
jgi:hypothetical protein